MPVLIASIRKALPVFCTDLKSVIRRFEGDPTFPIFDPAPTEVDYPAIDYQVRLSEEAIDEDCPYAMSYCAPTISISVLDELRIPRGRPRLASRPRDRRRSSLGIDR